MPANFVDVVGYQLEKTHTGVLAWLLDSRHSPLPLRHQIEIISRLAPVNLEVEAIKEVKAIREYSFGRRHRIDLVLKLNYFNGINYFILIECKTDSVVSVQQLAESQQYFAEQNPNNEFSCIILTIGAAQFTLMHQLNDIEDLGFHAINLSQTLEIFSNLPIIGEHVYDDWILAMNAETSRNLHISEDLANFANPWDAGLANLGYRTPFPVFYAFYGKLRNLLDDGHHQDWAIYSGGNNPIMNWNNGWIPLGDDEDAIEIYWEFNWQDFRLKAYLYDRNDEVRWDRWQIIRPTLVDLCVQCPIAGNIANNRRGQYVSAYVWKFNFCRQTPAEIANMTNQILLNLHNLFEGVG